MKQKYQFDVFISHSGKDEAIAIDVYNYLTSKGLRCWLDYYHIPPSSQAYAQCIVKGLEQSEKFLLLYSKNVVGSSDIPNEINMAKHMPMFVFKLDDSPYAGEYKYYLSRPQYIKAYPNYKKHLPQLYADIVGMSQQNQSPIPSKPTDPTPKRKWTWLLILVLLLVVVGLGLSHKSWRSMLTQIIHQQTIDTLVVDSLKATAEPIIDAPKNSPKTNESVPKPKPKISGPSGANTTPKTKPSSDKVFSVNGVDFRMMKIRGGQFAMGADSSTDSFAYPEEAPIHQVQLSDFYIGETEVTQALWAAVMGNTLEEHISKKDKKASPNGLGENYPMYYVSYDDCVAFIMALNKFTGESFRLPSEAEWEYAARERTSPNFYSGANVVGGVAWYDGNSSGTAQPVSQKKANALGLYDMCGNVAEWCMDWFDFYSSESCVNPLGPEDGELKVFRGGSWADKAVDCRVSCRTAWQPNYRSANIGFRLAL